MIRDFVAGALWGSVVAGVGLGVISQVSPLPRSGVEVVAPDLAPELAPETAPEQTATEAPVSSNISDETAAAIPPLEAAPAGTEAETSAMETRAETPAADAQDSGSEPDPATAEAAAAESGIPQAATAESRAPESGGPDSRPTDSAAAEAAAANGATEMPTPAPSSAATETTASQPEASAEDFGNGAVPAPEQIAEPAAAQAPAAPDLLAKADPQPKPPGQEGAAPALPEPGLSPETSVAEAPVAAVPPPAPATSLSPAPEGQTAPDIGVTPATPTADAETAPAAAPEGPASPEAEAPPASAELAPAAPAAPKDTLLEPAPAAEPAPAPAEITPDPALPAILSIETPERIAPDTAVTLTPDPGLKMGETGDLPAIGAAAAPQTPAADAPPVTRYAERFENPGAKPLFAILLIDPGTPDLDRVRLAALPFPVTFVLDPQAANVAEAAATYRAAGKEVVMLATGIPKGATAADLEQTFQSNAANLPEAVAVMDLPEDGFQDDRPLATQLVPIVKAEGRGLLTFDRGLNAADQVARREDVPAAVIFRRLDAEGEDLPVIRRYLDRAAFKAAQEGRVVVLGEAKPETVAAILEWTVEGRASSVALAPATAVLVVE